MLLAHDWTQDSSWKLMAVWTRGNESSSSCVGGRRTGSLTQGLAPTGGPRGGALRVELQLKARSGYGKGAVVLELRQRTTNIGMPKLFMKTS